MQETLHISKCSISLYSTEMNILRSFLRLIWLFTLILGSIHSSHILAATQRQVVDKPTIRMTITPRTPQQIAAFYEGREFPKTAINATHSACFFTVGIHNKSKNIIWLDTLRWQLKSNNSNIAIISKKQWATQWQKLNLQTRFQSTFRWTLLPQKLDFYPDEREAGNITIPRQSETFNLTAHFATGVDKRGQSIVLEFKDLQCAQESKQ